PLPTPSSWSIKPAGTCPRASSCRPTSPSFCCRRSAQSSTRSRTSGSSCATTGSPTASSNPTTISSTIVVRHGTSSSISLGASCPSDCANEPTGSDQWDLVLFCGCSLFHRGSFDFGLLALFIGFVQEPIDDARALLLLDPSVLRFLLLFSEELVVDFPTHWVLHL